MPAHRVKSLYAIDFDVINLLLSTDMFYDSFIP